MEVALIHRPAPPLRLSEIRLKFGGVPADAHEHSRHGRRPLPALAFMSAPRGSDVLDPVPPDGFEAAFAHETRELLLRRLRLGLQVGVVLYVAFWGLDLLAAPDYWLPFLIVRLAVAACTALALWISHTRWGVQRVVPLSVGIMYVGTLGMSVMTAIWSGFENQYYVGNMLAIFLVGLYFPWGAATTALYGALTIFTYLGLNTVVHGFQPIAAAAPFFFLGGTAILTVWAAAAQQRNRRESLRMRMQLEVANTELKSLDEAKTGFFANVSHELRTPLMLILGPIETLMRHDPNADADALLDAMNTNAHRLMRQVNLILNFSKIEAGQMTLTREVADLGAMLARTVNAAKPYAEGRAITLTGEGLEGLPQLAFDVEKVDTIANNLISNAMKFTPDGGRITVRAGVAGEHAATVWFEVEDSGCGIPADQVDKVFERFHQVKGGKGGKIQGTGLGLSLSKEFAEAHGGRIFARSKLGEGTTFRVELPNVDVASVQQAEGDASDAKAVKRVATTTTDFADLKRPSLEARSKPSTAQVPADAPLVLVVEDNADLRAFISGIVGARWRVQTATNGREGLETARRLRPDMIVSDVMMPEMDGFEMVETLRKDKAFASTPILFLSARTGSDAVVRGLTLGAVDYVNKPFKQAELEARIEAQLRLRAAEKTLAERDSRLLAMGQVAGTIAHDLRGPLQVLVNRLAILRLTAEVLDALPQMQEELDSIEKQSFRIEGMIQEMLEFMRGQDVTLDRRKTPVFPFLKTLAEEAARNMEGVGVKLKLEFHGDDAATLGWDQDRMTRVFENLFNNSRDALVQMCKDHPDPTVRFVVSADGVELVMKVSDNGPGIPPEVAGRLFQVGATSGKAHGTGFGLSIVKNLVQAHGGTIEVQAKGEDGGACFTIRFPRHVATEHGVEPPAMNADDAADAR
jgi:signal transduction histidine kinase